MALTQPQPRRYTCGTLDGLQYRIDLLVGRVFSSGRGGRGWFCVYIAVLDVYNSRFILESELHRSI